MFVLVQGDYPMAFGAEAEAAKEAVKNVDPTNPLVIAVTSAVASTIAYLAHLWRRGDIAKKALAAALKAEEKAKHIAESHDSVKGDIRKLNIRTRQLRKGVDTLSQQFKWSAEAAEAERENSKAMATSLQTQQMATHSMVVKVATILEERQKMRQEHALRTRRTDPPTPMPSILGEDE